MGIFKDILNETRKALDDAKYDFGEIMDDLKDSCIRACFGIDDNWYEDNGYIKVYPPFGKGYVWMPGPEPEDQAVDESEKTYKLETRHFDLGFKIICKVNIMLEKRVSCINVDKSFEQLFGNLSKDDSIATIFAANKILSCICDDSDGVEAGRVDVYSLMLKGELSPETIASFKENKANLSEYLERLLFMAQVAKIED